MKLFLTILIIGLILFIIHKIKDKCDYINSKEYKIYKLSKKYKNECNEYS
jgi:hypothetical protein